MCGENGWRRKECRPIALDSSLRHSFRQSSVNKWIGTYQKVGSTSMKRSDPPRGGAAPPPLLLSSSKLVISLRKAIIIWSISWQILECTKLRGADSTVSNPPFEVKVPCNLVKESLSFSNLVFSSLFSSYLWRICVSSETTGKKAERNSIKHSFEGSKPLHRK